MNNGNYDNGSGGSQGPVDERTRRMPPPVRGGRQKKRGSGCVIALVVIGLIGVALVVLIMAGGLLKGIGGGALRRQGPQARVIEELILMQPHVTDKIAVIDVKGVILGNVGLDGADAGIIRVHLRRALEDPEVVAIVLDLDTPGGEVTASDEIWKAVQEVKAEGKPVVACMRSVCASGGYYIAAAADYIVANGVTLTGSIGVMIPHFTYRDFLEKVGVSITPYKSGALKDMLSGAVERPESQELYIDQYMQELVDTTFMRFAAVVAEGRAGYDTAEEVKNAPFGDARIMLGHQALDYGLVDQLGYFDDALAKARELAGVSTANVVRYRKPFGLADILFSMESKSRVEVKLPDQFAYLTSRNLYYLMPELSR